MLVWSAELEPVLGNSKEATIRENDQEVEGSNSSNGRWALDPDSMSRPKEVGAL